MRKINITIDNKIKTKSFDELEELASFLEYDCGFIFDPWAVAVQLWTQNVGSKLDVDGFRFSIVSKREVA